MTAEIWVALLGGAMAGQVINALVTTRLARRERTHENQRWLWEKRLEAYVAFNDAVSTWQRSRAGEHRESVERLGAVLHEADRHVIVAPQETAQLAHQVAAAAMVITRGGDEVQEAWARFTDAKARLTVQHRVDLEATDWRSRRRGEKGLQMVDDFRAENELGPRDA